MYMLRDTHHVLQNKYYILRSQNNYFSNIFKSLFVHRCDNKICIICNMIMAMPLKPAPQFRHYPHLQNENLLSSCKAVIFLLLCWWLRWSPILCTCYDGIFRRNICVHHTTMMESQTNSVKHHQQHPNLRHLNSQYV